MSSRDFPAPRSAPSSLRWYLLCFLFHAEMHCAAGFHTYYQQSGGREHQRIYIQISTLFRRFVSPCNQHTHRPDLRAPAFRSASGVGKTFRVWKQKRHSHPQHLQNRHRNRFLPSQYGTSMRPRHLNMPTEINPARDNAEVRRSIKKLVLVRHHQTHHILKKDLKKKIIFCRPACSCSLSRR
jgi:hypothetical protein